jgi:FkbM family methyltransferase
MKLHKPSRINHYAKKIASPLSRVACSNILLPGLRIMDAYINFLIGKGSGAGWDLEEEVDAAIQTISNKNPIVFDVGANVGKWSQLFSQKVPQAKIFMFEPSPGSQTKIQSLNIPSAKLIPYAVGELAGVLSYYSSSETDASGSLHVRKDTPFQHLQYAPSEVPVTTLDEVIESHAVGRIDFMKMDIEGHELFALRGASRSLKAGKIRALSFEFGCCNVNSRTFFLDFWELLTSSGFKLYRITPSKKLVPVSDYYEDLEYFRGATNYIARLE